MTWTTHTLFGISALWLRAPLPPDLLVYDMGTLAACAALGALLAPARSGRVRVEDQAPEAAGHAVQAILAACPDRAS